MTGPSSTTRMAASTSQGGARDFLRAKARIGSCKNPVSYAPEQVVFHHDDIPENRRQRVKEVKEWASSQLLSTSRRPWTKTTKPDVPVCERRQAENAARQRSNPYAYNFRAETLDYARLVPPVDKPSKFRLSRQTESEVMELTRIMDDDPVQRGLLKRTQEMPVHPNLEDKIPWNNGMVLPVSVREAALDRLTVKSRQATKRVNETISLTKGYVTPIDQVRHLNETLREGKKNSTSLSSSQSGTMSSQQHHLHGTSSAAASTAAGGGGADEEVDRKSLKNRQAIEPSRKYSSYRHSGSWEYNAIERRFMWSDTGSFVYDSRGDVKITRDPDRYNLESVDMPRVRQRAPPLQHSAPWGSVLVVHH